MRQFLHMEMDALERRIALRLAELRAARGWSLDTLAKSSGISRATLSRIERRELSPTASMLGALCSAYGWTLSQLIAAVEGDSASVVRASDQLVWRDPGTGYTRRVVSPPGPGLRGEMVEVRLPPGAVVAFETAPVQRLEHHLWMLEGALRLDVEGTAYRLSKGDCLRYVLGGATRFEADGKRGARYVIALAHP